jgi:hypothetical protein
MYTSYTKETEAMKQAWEVAVKATGKSFPHLNEHLAGVLHWITGEMNE